MGSDHTGEDIEAGRTTRAENRTVIWAQTEKGSDFDGDAILVVEAAPTVADDDYKLVNESFPAHGILSSGMGTGTGVVGFNRKAPLLTPPAPAVELTPTDLRNARSVGVFGKGFTGAYMNRLPQMHERLKRPEEQLRPQKSTKSTKE